MHSANKSEHCILACGLVEEVWIGWASLEVQSKRSPQAILQEWRGEAEKLGLKPQRSAAFQINNTALHALTPFKNIILGCPPTHMSSLHSMYLISTSSLKLDTKQTQQRVYGVAIDSAPTHWVLSYFRTLHVSVQAWEDGGVHLWPQSANGPRQHSCVWEITN